MQKKIKINRRNIFLKLRPVLRWVIKLRSSPKAIAGGLGLGTFVAFTPTYGIQIFLAVLLATFFNLNRPAAIIPVWITNPVTIAPIYTFNYWIGCLFWQGPPVSQVSQTFIDIAVKLTSFDFWDIYNQFLELIKIGKDILIPLSIGSAIIGAVFGLAVYGVSNKLLIYFFDRKGKRKRIKELPRSTEKSDSPKS